jgi:hypothetical protein
MKINRIILENFKCFENEEFELSAPYTLIIRHLKKINYGCLIGLGRSIRDRHISNFTYRQIVAQMLRPYKIIQINTLFSGDV